MSPTDNAVAASPRPRGRPHPAPMTDPEAARELLRCIADGASLARETRARLDAIWSELAGLVAEAQGRGEPGETALAIGLEWARGRDPGRHASIVQALDAAKAGPPPAPSSEGPPPFRLNPIDSQTLFSTTHRLDWLIKHALVALQPCIVGGPKKSLKTSILIDLAISASTGTSFLGYFPVPMPVRVGFFSGESGQATIEETARRICAAKDIDPLDLGNIVWEFTLPQLSRRDHLEELTRVIRDGGLELVVIDPLYLCLLGGGAAQRLDASNLFDMGPLLMRISEVCLGERCTPLLVHHFRKGRENPYEPPELEDLAFAGIQEFARQWLLVGRRKKFEPGTGRHDLWLAVGGSAGHSGGWALGVDEGLLDDEFRGREWRLDVRLPSEIRAESGEQSKVAKAEAEIARARQKDEAAEQRHQMDATTAWEKLRQRGGPATKTEWRDELLGWNTARFGPAFGALKEAGRIRPTKVDVPTRNGTRPVDAWEVVLEAAERGAA